MKLYLTKTLLLFLTIFQSALSVQAIHLPNTPNKKLDFSINNFCNVVAGFTPSNDSIVPLTFPRGILFTNTSTNSTSIIWYMNGLYQGNENTLNLNFDIVGTYEIKLVATNNFCSDTAVSYIIYTGAQPVTRNSIKQYYGFPGVDDVSKAMIATYDNGYLIGGETQVRGQQQQSLHYRGSAGFLQKIDEFGCTKWTKIIESTYYGSIYKIIQLKDSNYAVLGSVDDISYLRKFDRQGQLIWNKNFSENLGKLDITIGDETDDGGFVLAGSAGLQNGYEIIRTDSNGNILWNKLYKLTNGFDVGCGVMGIVQKGDAIYVCGYANWSISNLNGSTIYSYNNLIKLNDSNGATQWTKTYTLNKNYTLLYEILSTKDGLLLNCRGAGGVQNNFIEISTDGNILASKGVKVEEVPLNSYLCVAKIHSNGDIYILVNSKEHLNLQPYVAYHSTFILLDKTYAPKWAMSVVNSKYLYSAIGKNGDFAGVGEEFGTVLAPYFSISTKIQFIKVKASGTDSANHYCTFFNLPTSIINTPAEVQPFSWTTDSSITVSTKDTGTRMQNTVYNETRYMCPVEYIDSCSLLKISGPGAICNLSAAYTYRLHRNKNCNETVEWNINAPVNIISKTDSSLTVKFKTFGNYRISALLPFACTPKMDSILISAVSKSPTLNIGADTSICMGNKLKLNAGDGFFSYKWQNGSINKTFTVSSPGIYWVQVSDSCNNIFTDTITVSFTSAIHVNAGGNRKKCNDDTLQLVAPTGFINYAWSPNYNISDTSLSIIIIHPLTDTSYNLKAEISAGCYAYDTVRVKVFHSNKIYLGSDTSICAGNTVHLNAGPGFVKYLWNTGVNTQQISITNKGIFSVVATDANSCSSFDTIKLIAVHPLPLIQLDTNAIICAGTSRILDAGQGFKDYLWNNGSTLRTLKINTPGIYSVVVTDVYNCSAKAQTEIKKILPVPAHFLPADTSICTYGTITINCLQEYSHYLWNNNTLNRSAVISSPGIVWLTVTDKNNCRGTDTIIVNKKDCLQGIFVPTAFSPNNDGYNDLFKPFIFGNILNYNFIIYNRFGQAVFESSELKKGWDGTIKGIRQNGSVFVWVCTFQLMGEAKITKKGTVILVR